MTELNSPTDIDIRKYCERRCYHCGAPRSEHVHAFTPDRQLEVLAPHREKCKGFLDEIEHYLGGDPLYNKLTAPILREKVAALGLPLPDDAK